MTKVIPAPSSSAPPLEKTLAAIDNNMPVQIKKARKTYLRSIVDQGMGGAIVLPKLLKLIMGQKVKVQLMAL